MGERGMTRCGMNRERTFTELIPHVHATNSIKSSVGYVTSDTFPTWKISKQVKKKTLYKFTIQKMYRDIY